MTDVGRETKKINNAPDESSLPELKLIEETVPELKMSLMDIAAAVRDSIRDTLSMIAEMMEANSAMLDNQIAKQQSALDQHVTKEQELRDIARERLDATESIEAER
ncbi:MAG: hypothetical protein IPN22_14915 [Bacteroidetes bacterium]|nr:hypothetical protein [Bacteroidota bacterium]